MMAPYSVPVYDGTEIIPVQSGFEVENEETGEKLVVDEQHAVMKRGTIYVTWTMYEKLKSSPLGTNKRNGDPR